MIYVLIFYYWRSPWEQDVTSGRTIRYLQSLNWSIVIPPSSFVLAILWPLVTNGTSQNGRAGMNYEVDFLFLISWLPFRDRFFLHPIHTWASVWVPAPFTTLNYFYTHTFVKSKVIKKKKKTRYNITKSWLKI